MTKMLRAIFCLVVVFASICAIPLYPANSEEIPLNQYGIRSTNPYLVDRVVVNGKTIDKIIVPGPPSPPLGFVRLTVDTLPVPNPAAGINILTNMPASTWAFGCSATSAAMMFGHYDNSGFTNMYAGPTNGGVFPMTNATWGTVLINGETRALNPLSATRNGLDGRAIKGHVDDYWIKYGNTASDPFITGSWAEHTQGDCTGDYMGTNQSSFGNSDGSTTFYNYTNGSPLYDYTGAEPSHRDGCHGMKLFIESRGYAVQSLGNFNQYIYGYNGNTLGFTFANFKAEIDAGRPVLIQVAGHTMLGFGYDDTGSTIYIHDTWDYLNHTMTWGGSYSGMVHYGVTVFRLVSIASFQVLSPNGGESWTAGESHDITWTSTGTVGNVDILYSYNGGADWTSVVADTANDGSYSWTVPDTPSSNCYVQVLEHADGSPYDSSDAVFTIVTSGGETVSAPNTPSGPTTGVISTSYDYSTGGSTSSLGHSVQYKFDWDDGSDSGWLAVGTTEASHSWAAAGTYNVRAMARCADHPTVESLWSTTLAIIITDGDSTGHYNSPAQYKVLPEVIWASATGGGTWMSNVQVTDVSGGSQVSVYYNTASGRRGPFLLWDNTAGGALSSVKYANLLQTIDVLDSGTFTYYGTVGAVEFITQDGSHLLQAAARTLNGYYAKTFTALSLHDANTADSGRAMIVANLSNNVTYRSTSGFFNPTSDSVTVEFTLLNGSGAQIGSQFSKTLAGHDFQAFNPFIQAGVPYPGSSYDNAILRVRPTTGAGEVMCFGATVDNTSNDPAAHVAVQGTTGYDNGPGSQQILPEVIWASATGGGTWMSNVQVTDVSGGSQVSVYYNTASGRRGPFLLWDNSGRRRAQQRQVRQPAGDHRRPGQRDVYLLRHGGGGGVRQAGRQPPAAGGGADAERQLRKDLIGAEPGGGGDGRHDAGHADPELHQQCRLPFDLRVFQSNGRRGDGGVHAC